MSRFPKLKIRNLNEELDPNFGYETQGTPAAEMGNWTICSGRFTLIEDGIATSMSVCINRAEADPDTGKFKLAIYDVDGEDNPDNLIAVSEEGTFGQTKQFYTVNISAELSAGTYFLVLLCSEHYNIYYDAGASTQFQFSDGQTYPTFPDPWGISEYTASAKPSIFCTYTKVVVGGVFGIEKTYLVLTH